MSNLKIEHKSTLYHGNDLARLLVVSKINQGNQSGLGFKKNIAPFAVISGSYVNTTMQRGVFDSRVMVVRYMPSLGGSIGEERASEAFTKFYNAVVGTAYTTTDFGRADLQKHVILAEGLITWLDEIDRALDCLAPVDYSNRSVQLVRKALRFALNGNADNYAQCVAARNELLTLFQKLIVPSSIPAVSRHRALCRNVYCDDVHDKTQLVIFEPYFTYGQLTDNFDVAPVSRGYSMSVLTSIQGLRECLLDYINSAFYNTISPYLYRAMLDPNGPKIATPYEFSTYEATLVPKLQLNAIYDVEVLQMIRNGDFIGSVLNNAAPEAINDLDNSLIISEDNDEICRQGKANGNDGLYLRPFVLDDTTEHSGLNLHAINYASLTAMTPQTLVYPVSNTNKLLYTEDFPTPEDTTYICMNAKIDCNVVNAQGFTRKIAYSGDLILIDLKILTPNALDGDDNEQTILVTPWFVPFVVLQNKSSTYNYVDGNIVIHLDWMGTQSSSLSSTHTRLLAQYIGVQSFKCAPILKYYLASANFTCAMENTGDIDNVLEVPLSAFRNFVNYNIYDMFNFENGRCSQANHGRDGKRSSKHNKKSKSSGKGNPNPEGKDAENKK